MSASADARSRIPGPESPSGRRHGYGATVEIMTSGGPAHVVLDKPAGEPAFLIALTHGAGGTPDSPDLLAVRDAARTRGALTALVTQPYRVKGARAPRLGDTPGRGLDGDHGRADGPNRGGRRAARPGR